MTVTKAAGHSLVMPHTLLSAMHATLTHRTIQSITLIRNTQTCYNLLQQPGGTDNSPC